MSSTVDDIKMHLVDEWRYWHIDRRTQRFIPFLARNLPKRIKYYVVIHGMVTANPDGNPSDVTGMQLLELWDPEP